MPGLEEKLKKLLDGGAEEVSSRDRGRGFVKWNAEGDWVQGVFVDKWETKAGPVVTLRLTEEPTASVETKDGEKAVPSP
jgi:hypothetical protein